jgi:hypothetical protein
MVAIPAAAYQSLYFDALPVTLPRVEVILIFILLVIVINAACLPTKRTAVSFAQNNIGKAEGWI